MSLLLKAVSYRWPGAAAGGLRDLGFELSSGGILALVGPNGAGKSTALRLAAGLLEADAGSVELDGLALARMDARSRARRVSFLAQAERLPFAFRAMDFVVLGRAPRIPGLRGPGARDRRIAAEALERLGGAALAERPVVELSAGELQTVRLARSLAQDAEYLILDEPTATLDPARTLAVGALLRRLAGEGRAILLAAHDLGFSRDVADRVLVLRAGACLALGPPEAILVPETLERAYDTPFRQALMPVPDHAGLRSL